MRQDELSCSLTNPLVWGLVSRLKLAYRCLGNGSRRWRYCPLKPPGTCPAYARTTLTRLLGALDQSLIVSDYLKSYIVDPFPRAICLFPRFKPDFKSLIHLHVVMADN